MTGGAITIPRVGRASLVLAAIAIAASAVWAFLPLGSTQATVPEIAAGSAMTPGPARVALDVSAFSAPLWVAPEPPPSTRAAAAPPPPPPLRWQLLAIVKEASGYKAFLYDPDTDKVLVLIEGDQSGTRRISRVTPTSVDVRDAAGVRTLALREPGGRP